MEYKNKGETVSDVHQEMNTQYQCCIILTNKLLKEKSKAKQAKGKKLPEFHSSKAAVLGDYFNYIR